MVAAVAALRHRQADLHDDGHAQGSNNTIAVSSSSSNSMVININISLVDSGINSNNVAMVDGPVTPDYCQPGSRTWTQGASPTSRAHSPFPARVQPTQNPAPPCPPHTHLHVAAAARPRRGRAARARALLGRVACMGRRAESGGGQALVARAAALMRVHRACRALPASILVDPPPHTTACKPCQPANHPTHPPVRLSSWPRCMLVSGRCPSRASCTSEAARCSRPWEGNGSTRWQRHRNSKVAAVSSSSSMCSQTPARRPTST